MSRIHWELLTSGNWRHDAHHNTHIVYHQVGLPDYRLWTSVFICSTRGRNLHEYIRKNFRSTWITLHVQIYIENNKIYIHSITRRMSLVQGIHKDDKPQRVIQTMQYRTLSFIPSKWTRYCNSYCISIQNSGNQRQNRTDEYDWMHQEIIFNSINGWDRGIRRM